MSNYEKYLNAFIQTFDVTKEIAEKLKYQDVASWNSVGHIRLITELEDLFDIMFETSDIIDFNSFEKGIEILEQKYSVIIK